MKNLMAPVRNKTVDIANVLLRDGSPEGSAIAISQAKKWAGKRGVKVKKTRGTGK